MKLKDFELATSDEISEAEFPPGFKGGIVGGGILIGSPGGIHSTFVYKVMKDTFGPYNANWVGEKSTWKWVLKTEKYLLSVYDYKGGWSIGYVGNMRRRSKELIIHAESLKNAILEEAGKIHISRKKIKESKVGGSIFNPYALFSSTSILLLKEARNVISEIESYKSSKDDPFHVKALNRGVAIAALYRSAFLMNYLALEGFVNVVHTIFLNKRYRNDFFERKLQNEMIVTKLLEIDRYCDEFVKQVINSDEDLFKAFQHLTNIRNDFLHANISKGMESHLIRIGEYELLTKEKSEEKYGIKSHPGELTNVDVIRSQRIVEKIVAKIINALDERIRSKFAIVHSYHRLPYYFNEQGRVDIPITEDDFMPDEEIEDLLSLTPDLDEEYYDIGEDEYITPLSRVFL
ncbi:MAG: hypothetical protein ACXAB4_02830 [Candidatus Hodarchaeales archaeon]|jgi:hypothetical protein